MPASVRALIRDFVVIFLSIINVGQSIQSRYCGIILIKRNRSTRLEALELARRAVDVASDKQASNIVLLDVREVCSFADYFIICSGESARQISSISDEIEKTLKKNNVLPHHREGELDSGWLLLDYTDVIIHIFGVAERDYYKLDELWQKAKTVLRIQ
jgi:ribosome-associated protein